MQTYSFAFLTQDWPKDYFLVQRKVLEMYRKENIRMWAICRVSQTMTIQIFTMSNNSDLTQVPDYIQKLVITSSETRPKNNMEKAKHNKLDRRENYCSCPNLLMSGWPLRGSVVVSRWHITKTQWVCLMWSIRDNKEMKKIQVQEPKRTQKVGVLQKNRDERPYCGRHNVPL